MNWLRNRILRWAEGRQPDFVIGGKENPYLRRHWLIPRNPFFNVYVHEFLRSDDDRALHDHPWLFNCSWLLQGQYVEHTILAGGVTKSTYRKAGEWRLRWGRSPHRLSLGREVLAPKHPRGYFRSGAELPCWTVFITGPRVREWGFYCMERGWVHWKTFTAPEDKGSVGRGCA